MKIPKKEEGQGLVEYALLLVLVAVIVIAILTLLGSQVMLVFARVAGGLNGQIITGVGSETIITGYDATVSQSGPSCSASITDVTFVGLQDGELVKNGSATVKFRMGDDVESVTGSTGNNGMGTYSGTISLSSTSCDITPGG
jgi:pilus assembly protein Flp/PilA